MGTPLRVLMIEDSGSDEKAMLWALNRAGYDVSHQRVETAQALSEALDRAEWDVVLTDHNMPQFDSLSAVRVTREREADVPLIIVSGTIGEDVVASGMRAGANDYVSKDDLPRLAAAIERARADASERRGRRRAEAALRESEERFALAVRGSQDGIWDWKLITGEIYYSSRFKEMLGFGPDELEGLAPFIAQVEPAERGRLWLAFEAHVEAREPLNLELAIRTKAGEGRWFSVRGQAQWDEATGKAVRIAGSLSDMSARKRAETELKEQLEIVRLQREEIRVLSAPIIELWDGVLTVPVVGEFDGERASRLMEALLNAVVRTGCDRAILDLTAVAAIDASTADHLIQLIGAVRLLGADGIIVGVQPQVASAMVANGLDLSAIPTYANLRQALRVILGNRNRRR